jgi:hypothetical protein
MIEILNRWTKAVLFSSEKAQTIADAVAEAVRSRAHLIEADLSEADLSGADLRETDLSGANLSETDLSGANLIEANLSGANLIEANLRGANLSEANLSGAKQKILVIQGSRNQIVAINNQVRIGCYYHKLDYWLRHYKEIGRDAGYSNPQIKEYKLHLQHIKKCLTATTPKQ